MSEHDDEVYDLADRGDDRPGLEDADNLDEDYDEDDDLDDDDDDDDEFDDLEDASEDEIDFVIGIWREDGTPQVADLGKDLANDLEDLIDELRRIPGDGGALGVVSINGDFFVLCRVRGQKVQVLLSDALAATEYPIARDVADYLDEDVDEDDEDAGPLGDVDMLVDLGVPEFDLEQIADSDEDSSDSSQQVADRLGVGAAFGKLAG